MKYFSSSKCWVFVLEWVENIVGKGENADCQHFLISSTGRRPASLCHGPLSVVRPSVR